MITFFRGVVFTSAVAIAGCAAGPDAIVQTVRTAISGDSGATDNAKLDPRFLYLRVTIAGRVALLVLGFKEAHPRGPIEVWYSAEREVLKLQGGRVVGAVGMLTEWRNVAVSEMPDWSALANSPTTAHIVRTRDVMPGYRFGVRDALTLTRIPAPSRSTLRDVPADSLAWFEERADGLPAARYAVRLAGANPMVVYGEQCLAPEVCFTWQRWPAGS